MLGIPVLDTLIWIMILLSFLFAVVLPIVLLIKLIRDAIAGKDVYVVWTILTTVLFLIKWQFGLASAVAEVITLIIEKIREPKNGERQQHPEITSEPAHDYQENHARTAYTPTPGSVADYERWKEEREKTQCGGNTE